MIDKAKKILQGPFRALCVLAVLWAAMPTAAQQLGLPQTDVLTISSDRLFADSAFGQRVFREIEAESALLAEENERIVAQLSQEEKDLTEKRATLSAEEFRPMAEAFDEKVQSHRDGQRAKLDALARLGEQARDQFFEMAQPVLIELLRDYGASIVIERANVVLSSDASDITQAAITRIDAAIGDGAVLEINNSE
ncbi:periplasmic chaperone for outer membrane proteins Skp [Ruegeria halocynthiae]|uniref:Periplasmic chaperone for outer membrane proteins Skp n=1 Tax=Ruegeria halocynthiae TaxID=985054 RepID=A0A1H2TKX4_9RHOB|nr:OmpH family outer membrane protein [Ruegeria halocynthiae]SDW43889.1 periplasmic chaperone for outer membrane proteins Skp [Ruegeria halocynthiae]